MRWIVDGMNVIGSRPDGWWRDRHAAMVRLVDLLERWAAAEGEDVTVMFEGPPRPPIRSSVVDVAHASHRGANAADHEIVRRIDADDDPSAIRVVTSDRVLADQARARGAAVHPAESFRNEIDPR
ncbi:MAG: NYN domain-containing protein [Solirubrobacteraceae bacterium]